MSIESGKDFCGSELVIGSKVFFVANGEKLSKVMTSGVVVGFEEFESSVLVHIKNDDTRRVVTREDKQIALR